MSLDPLSMPASGCCHQPDAPCDCAKDPDLKQKSVKEEVGEGPEHCTVQMTAIGHLASSAIKPLSSSDGPICRICYEGGSAEVLLSPCNCRGTQANVHKSCLELWLASSNKSYCVLCRARFNVKRTVKPFRQWLCHPDSEDERIIRSCTLTTFSTLLVYILIRLLVPFPRNHWMDLAMITTGMLLGWLLMVMPLHWTQYSLWKTKNQQVHLIIPNTDEAVSSQPRTV
ncbi:E3 ubiquitin-protein ligase MARCHF2-like [Festucalex cinctus]